MSCSETHSEFLAGMVVADRRQPPDELLYNSLLEGGFERSRERDNGEFCRINQSSISFLVSRGETWLKVSRSLTVFHNDFTWGNGSRRVPLMPGLGALSISRRVTKYDRLTSAASNQ